MSHQLAKDLHASGFRVFEIVPQTKRPALRGWQARAEKGDLSYWKEGCAVGIATGGPYPNGKYLVVIDVDNKPSENRDGFASLAALEKANEPLPHCPRVRTRSGGRHYYMWSPVPVANGVGRVDADGKLHGIANGIDIRGTGGLVVAPGQMGYSWEEDSATFQEFFRAGEW
ncbi:bifunctional DNA primase/polymerase [Elioraea rosea]|uniref:bifunctional DNA primase/polymerase n=1 Tax=Elioraea rosea TaxID=2492390 RepID=UPI0023B7B3D6|nr:bifunctional DNA primase/polymerase [Elioraea rosea]